MDRRRFIFTAAGLVTAQLFTATRANSQAGEPGSQDMSVAQWMDGWMQTKGLSGPLHLSRFVEPIYFLLQPISWHASADSQVKYEPVTAPKGFVTDFASIPRVFFSLLRPDAEYAYAAILHDYLYWMQSRSREEADLIFKLAMEDLEVKPSIVATVYRAVRTFGQSAWDGNAQLRAKGEKRVLQAFPEDPRTYWRDWKKQGERFL